MSRFNPQDLRRALGAFATGVTVVTTIDSVGQPRGFTANSFTSVSLDPPLVLVCVAKAAPSCSVFSNTEHFAINILAESQRAVSASFSSKDGKRFSEINWQKGSTGSPLIEEVVAWFECVKHDTVDAGDHFILLGRVVDYQYTSKTPIGYCRGAYVTFGLAEAAIRASEHQDLMRVAAIVEYRGTIYLVRNKIADTFDLPTASRLGSIEDADSLIGKLNAAGINAGLAFLFSVYEDPQTGEQNIVYRGEAKSVDPDAKDYFVQLVEIPWEKIENDTVRTMLKRYVHERQEDTFGVYVGNAEAGRVDTLVESWHGSHYM